MNKVNWKLVRANAAWMSLVGLIVALSMLVFIGNMIALWMPLSLFLLSAITGAGLAGALTYGFFGREGKLGWGMAFLGGLVATVLGASFAGVLFLPFRQFDLAYTALFFSLVSPTAIAWLGAMAGLHLRMAQKRLGHVQTVSKSDLV